jgi:hypothetical protein
MHYFRIEIMNKNGKTYNFYQKGSAVFMILTLLWLTISTPFVIAGQQELAKMEKMSDSKACTPDTEEDTDNPLGNTNEEKTSGASSSFSEEYLHEHHDNHFFVTLTSLYNKCDNADTYHAYHGELLVPPPNAA